MPEIKLRKSATVLLVDDNDSARTGLTELLTRKGYRAFEASSAEHALDLVMQLGNDLDVLVTDIAMPGMNGFELSKTVRCLNPSIVIIYMSAYCLAESDDSGSINDLVLSKPIPITTLVEALEGALRKDADNSSCALA